MQELTKLFALAAAGALSTTIFATVPAMAGGHGAQHAANEHHVANIVEAASASTDHSTLVAAVKAAGLSDTLAGSGPFTIFAPTDAAFDKLPEGTVDLLLQPENRASLTKVLTYHVIPGRVTSSELVDLIKESGGAAALTTVEGGSLTARLENGSVVLVDDKGGTATVSQADLIQSNGVIHITDTVSMPG